MRLAWIREDRPLRFDVDLKKHGEAIKTYYCYSREGAERFAARLRELDPEWEVTITEVM